MRKVARVRGIEIAYTDEGAGTTVVMLHGFPFNRTMWSEQAESLRGAWRVVAPDLRGHGETTVTDGPATMEELADDLAALLDELNIERAVIAGLSMGGYVALAFVRKYAERVRALVLADTRAQADTDEARHTREVNAQRALKDGMHEIADVMLPKLLTQETSERNTEVLARVREMILGTNPRGAAAALRGMALRRDQTDLLPEISMPTLIIVGSEDSITPPADAEAMHAKIKGSRLVMIEGAGHVSNIERPCEFNHALEEFLSSLKP
jgi:3-oxoadipate enol-lactonase